MLKFACTTYEANKDHLERLTCSDAITVNGSDLENSTDGKSKLELAFAQMITNFCVDTIQNLMEDCPAFCCSFQLKKTEEESKGDDADGGEPVSSSGEKKKVERDASMEVAEVSAFEEDADEEMNNHEAGMDSNSSPAI